MTDYPPSRRTNEKPKFGITPPSLETAVGIHDETIVDLGKSIDEFKGQGVVYIRPSELDVDRHVTSNGFRISQSYIIEGVSSSIVYDLIIGKFNFMSSPPSNLPEGAYHCRFSIDCYDKVDSGIRAIKEDWDNKNST
jgi:hypothetical protein